MDGRANLPNRSKDEFIQDASLSQQLADLKPDYQDLAGSDPIISKKIQRIKVWVRNKLVTEQEVKLLLEMLDGDRMAAFATSEKTNEITKMGLQMPKKVSDIDL